MSGIRMENWPIERLVAYENNPKRHPMMQVRAIAKSIQEFGFNDPICVADDGEILAGHGRYQAAQLLDMKVVPVLVVTGMDKDKARSLFRIAHNQLTLSSGFDAVKLTELFRVLSESDEIDMEAIGFSQSDIQSIMKRTAAGETEIEPMTYKYEIVFDSKEQLQKWNTFLRRLKKSSRITGPHSKRIMEIVGKTGAL